jgi:hypothetical protein
MKPSSQIIIQHLFKIAFSVNGVPMPDNMKKLGAILIFPLLPPRSFINSSESQDLSAPIQKPATLYPIVESNSAVGYRHCLTVEKNPSILCIQVRETVPDPFPGRRSSHLGVERGIIYLYDIPFNGEHAFFYQSLHQFHKSLVGIPGVGKIVPADHHPVHHGADNNEEQGEEKQGQPFGIVSCHAFSPETRRTMPAAMKLMIIELPP